jgi:predicted nucleotidyltransferase
MQVEWQVRVNTKRIGVRRVQILRMEILVNVRARFRRSENE